MTKGIYIRILFLINSNVLNTFDATALEV